MKLISFAFLLFVFSCVNKNTILIKNVSIDSCYTVPLGEDTFKLYKSVTVAVEIVKNTLDDTAMIDGKRISPNYVGDIERWSDDYNDIGPTICFKSYKAKKGKLKIKYRY